jgi:hypothetical protein
VLTPSAASESDRDEDQSSSEKQVYEDATAKFDMTSNQSGLNVSGSNPDFNAERLQELDGDIFKGPYESLDRQPKVIGCIMTFERSIASNEGLGVIHSVGDHLSTNLDGSLTKSVPYLSREMANWK